MECCSLGVELSGRRNFQDGHYSQSCILVACIWTVSLFPTAKRAVHMDRLSNVADFADGDVDIATAVE